MTQPINSLESLIMEFPEPLDHNNTEDFFRYIQRDLGGWVHYEETKKYQINDDRDEDPVGSVKVGGMIKSDKHGFAVPFCLMKQGFDSKLNQYTHLCFHYSANIDFSDISDVEKNIITYLHKLIPEYFKQREREER